MNFSLNHTHIHQLKTDCLIVGIFEKNELTPAAEKIDQISKGYLTEILKNGEFSGKTGKTFLLYAVPNLQSKRLLLIGCGKQNHLSVRDFRKIIHSGIKALNTSKAKNIV